MKKHIFVSSAGLLTIVGLMVSGASAKATPHFRISAAQATAIVLKKFPGKLTEKTQLENEEGVWQYGVMVKSGRTLREVMVDAKTGKIANVETTTASKEQVEKKADAVDEAKAAMKAKNKTTVSHKASNGVKTHQ